MYNKVALWGQPIPFNVFVRHVRSTLTLKWLDNELGTSFKTALKIIRQRRKIFDVMIHYWARYTPGFHCTVSNSVENVGNVSIIKPVITVQRDRVEHWSNSTTSIWGFLKFSMITPNTRPQVSSNTRESWLVPLEPLFGIPVFKVLANIIIQ